MVSTTVGLALPVVGFVALVAFRAAPFCVVALAAGVALFAAAAFLGVGVADPEAGSVSRPAGIALVTASPAVTSPAAGAPLAGVADFRAVGARRALGVLLVTSVEVGADCRPVVSATASPDAAGPVCPAVVADGATSAGWGACPAAGG
ncbi:hypothetical protein [Micromonospora sp. KC606]|uniref:hypothetical protein n=1 Tax=Micromonospora sp. KC606 TaxID=2530379 RepID=UPI001FB6503F|nr:hypothetical protein [Micromonospora sp. KC606]